MPHIVARPAFEDMMNRNYLRCYLLYGVLVIFFLQIWHYVAINGPSNPTLLILIVLSPRILPGITIGYSAIALPQLNITIDEASWFSSLTLLGGPFGFIISGFLIDRLGRKFSLICCLLPSIIGWYLLTSDFSAGRTYFGRFLTGFTTGSGAHAVGTYLEESYMLRIADFGSRFITWSATALAFGTCIVYSFGSAFSYQEVAFINLVISVSLLVLVVIFVPESPAWLYKKGKVGDADLAQRYLDLEFPFGDFSSAESSGSATNSSLRTTSWRNLARVFLTREAYKPLFVTTILLSFSMLSGGLTLSTYMVNAIETRTFFKHSYHFAIVSGILQFLVSASVSFILPYSGNRKLTLISGGGLAVGMFVIALTTQMGHEPDFYHQKFVDHVHTLAVWFSISMFSIGFLTLPTALLREVFPPEVQCLACIPIMVSFAVNCIVIKMHLHLFRYFGGVVYIFYAAMDVIGTYLVWILMPETMGRTLKHIQSEYFLNN